jgi:hypothetical protein
MRAHTRLGWAVRCVWAGYKVINDNIGPVSVLLMPTAPGLTREMDSSGGGI